MWSFPHSTWYVLCLIFKHDWQVWVQALMHQFIHLSSVMRWYLKHCWVDSDNTYWFVSPSCFVLLNIKLRRVPHCSFFTQQLCKISDTVGLISLQFNYITQNMWSTFGPKGVCSMNTVNNSGPIIFLHSETARNFEWIDRKYKEPP